MCVCCGEGGGGGRGKRAEGFGIRNIAAESPKAESTTILACEFLQQSVFRSVLSFALRHLSALREQLDEFAGELSQLFWVDFFILLIPYQTFSLNCSYCYF